MSNPPFQSVVEQHGHVLLRTCRALVGRDDAEDLWSETFLAALAAYPRLRPDSNIRAWLLTIARHKAIDRSRTSGRAALAMDPLPEQTSTLGLPGEQDDELRSALDALSARQRGAVVYHYLADLPYAQVAQLIGSTEAAARRAAADGIASLRSALGEEVG